MSTLLTHPCPKTLCLNHSAGAEGYATEESGPCIVVIYNTGVKNLSAVGARPGSLV